MQAEKIEFGVSNVHIFGMIESEDTWECESPEAVASCKSLKLDPVGEKETIYADNIAWYVDKNTGKMKAEVSFIRVLDSFREKYLGYKKATGGGLWEVGEDKRVGIMFQADTDLKPNKYVLVNGIIGREKEEYQTVEDKKNVKVTTFEIDFEGVNIAGFHSCKCKVAPDDELYANLFKQPFVIPTSFAEPVSLKK